MTIGGNHQKDGIPHYMGNVIHAHFGERNIDQPPHGGNREWRCRLPWTFCRPVLSTMCSRTPSCTTPPSAPRGFDAGFKELTDVFGMCPSPSHVEPARRFWLWQVGEDVWPLFFCQGTPSCTFGRHQPIVSKMMSAKACQVKLHVHLILLALRSSNSRFVGPQTMNPQNGLCPNSNMPVPKIPAKLGVGRAHR